MTRNTTEEILEMQTDEFGGGVDIRAQGAKDSEMIIDRLIIHDIDGKQIIDGQRLDAIVGIVLQYCESRGFIEFTDKLNIKEQCL